MPLRVGLSPLPGFVEKKPSGDPTGLSVDLVKLIAADLGRPVQYLWMDNVAATLDAVQKSAVDVGIGAISVTAARERVVDFTHAYSTVGLGMAVRAKPASWWTRLSASMTKGRLSIILGFFLLIVVAGHLVWLAERGKDAFADAYFPGVFEGMYWAIVTASTVGYGDKAPVKWAGRALAGLVIVISLPMFAIFTAELTSALTAGEILDGQLRTPRDLGTRTAAVVAGTTSAEFAHLRALVYKAFPTADAAVAAVVDGTADAAIYDEGPLRAIVQRAAQAGKDPLRVVAGTFDPTPIAWAVPRQSPDLEALNVALLAHLEEGDIDRLKARWLGAK